MRPVSTNVSLFVFLLVGIPLILDVRLHLSVWYVDAPAGVTQEELFFLHPFSAVLALIFIARRIQPVPFPRRP